MFVLAFLGHRFESHQSSDFIAHAAIADAVIDSLHDGPPSQDIYGPSWFNEYATVHYEADTRLVHSTVTVGTKCTSVCLPIHNVGDNIRIAYDTRNVSSAVYPVPKGRLGVNPLGWNPLVLFAAVAGVGSLAVAILNLILGSEPPRIARRGR